MIVLMIITGVAVCVSLLADQRRTRQGLRTAWKMFLSIAPMMVGLLAAISLVLAAFPPTAIQSMLASDSPAAFATAVAIGSITLIPGFISYPLAAVLRENGASYLIIAGFITTLMMVGVLTLPLEARFFGWRMALLRNALAFVGALTVALAMGTVL